MVSLEYLKEVNEAHTPEMKHFMGLERMNRQIEIEHKQREQGVQKLIQQTHPIVKTDYNVEVEKLRNLHN